jgi:clan AA aspartic protease (TIGR02281 family)
VPSPSPPFDSIPFLYNDTGGMVVVVNVGNKTLPMAVDTGASGSTITETLAGQLLIEGHAVQGPIVDATLANGVTHKVRTITVDTMTVGNHLLRDVNMMVEPDGASLLLGLRELTLIGKFTVDADNRKIIFSS